MRFWASEPGASNVWPTHAQELLLKAALLPDERAIDAWRTVRPQMDVDRLDHSVQAVLPCLRANLLALGVDDELLSLFKGVHRYLWAQNQLLLARLMPVVGALERAGIPTLLLKGAALVAGSRLDAGIRPMDDVDILVPTDKLGPAVDILLDAGLVSTGGFPAWWAVQYMPSYAAGHEFEMFERGRSLRLDLHWHATLWSRQPGADDDLWLHARAVELHEVSTRALAPGDELTLAILHGLVWQGSPTYRWVLDATLLARGVAGPVDFGRLVDLARRRKTVAALTAGLAYLRRTVSAPIPAQTIRALRRSVAGPIERRELRAQARPPQTFGPLDWAVLRHQQGVRRRARSGGRPAIDSPAGNGVLPVEVEPVAIGEKIFFGDPERVRLHLRSGMWFPHPDGCVLAGREARLMLALPHPVKGPLLLALSAHALFIPGKVTPQRLDVLVGGSSVARFSLDGSRSELLSEGVVLPRAAVSRRAALEVTLRMPDAMPAPRHPAEIEYRRQGIFLRDLVVHEPALCQPGQSLWLGLGSGDEKLLGGGWGAPEPTGRWTWGPHARLLIDAGVTRAPLTLNLDASPLHESQRVDVSVIGGRRRRLRWDVPDGCQVAVPAGAREVLVDLHVRRPTSPAELGLTEDRRPLGLFVRSVGLSSSLDAEAAVQDGLTIK